MKEEGDDEPELGTKLEEDEEDLRHPQVSDQDLQANLNMFTYLVVVVVSARVEELLNTHVSDQIIGKQLQISFAVTIR